MSTIANVEVPGTQVRIMISKRTRDFSVVRLGQPGLVPQRSIRIRTEPDARKAANVFWAETVAARNARTAR